MSRDPLIAMLERHAARPLGPAESGMVAQTLAFVRATPDCFERSHLAGHVTGSAWIVDRERGACVLLHHGKLDRWLQPGGHADGDPDVARTALREAQEETGLRSLRFASAEIFDVDIHEIPESRQAPRHLHYDIRFCLEADRAEAPQTSSESRSVKWIENAQVAKYAPHPSILRMLDKAARGRFNPR